jgi:hypothetical protein
MNLRSVDLNLLVTFEAVLTERSVSAAAERLGVTQSAVSHALRRRAVFHDQLLVRGPAGDRSVVARQFDAALMLVGFKASRELLEHLSGLDAGTVIDAAVRVLAAVREQVGDHVRHNTYFRDFPSVCRTLSISERSSRLAAVACRHVA